MVTNRARSAAAVFAIVIAFVVIAASSSLAAPILSSLSPTSGTSGALVTVTGSGFGATKGTSIVKFGGVTASTNSWSDTSIVAVLPSNVSGLINVQVTVSSIGSNTVSFIAGTNPTISSLSTNSAPIDAEIIIYGANFGSSQGSSTVAFNGTQAIASSWSATSITAIVPFGATTGSVKVTVNNVASNGIAFMVTPPQQQGGVGFVQGTYSDIGQCTSGGGPYTTEFVQRLPLDVQTGNLILVVASYQELNSSSVDSQVAGDQLDNSYALTATSTNSGTKRQKTFYASNIIGGPDTIIVDLVSSKGCVATPEVRIAEYKGLATSGNFGYPLDVSSTTISSSGTACNSGSKTTTNQNDLLIGANLAGQTTTAPGTNYTNRVITTPDGNILEDRIVTSTGSYNAAATMASSGSCLMDMVAFKEAPNQAPVLDAGPSQALTWPTNSVFLNGSVTDDGLPNNTLTISWSKVSGPGTVTFTSPSTANTQATFSTYGTYVLQLSANDSQLTTTSNVTVTVNSQPIALALSLTTPAAGPDVTGSSQKITALLRNGTGPTSTPIVNAAVQFTVTGANATTGSGTTDSNGNATFTYTGSHSGNDTVQASYTGQNSNSLSVSWLVPVQGVSTSTVLGRFFMSDGSGAFDILPSATPVFSEYFPTINFNPPSGTVPGTPSSINQNTRPFTDVTADINGNFTGSIVAQGNGLQAGVGALGSFQAVFTGTLTAASSGNKTININDDDGYFIGIGNGATCPTQPCSSSGNDWVGAPSSGLTPFTGLPVIAAYNGPTGVRPSVVTVYFPAPGNYPYEVDYSECCGGQEVLTMTVGSNNSPGVPPTGTLYLSPINPSSQNTGQTQTFLVAVTDATGAAVQNVPVVLIVTGANQKQLTATTDSIGHASFQYSGSNGGVDQVQANAVVSGMGEYSNSVNMTWNVAVGSGAAVFVPQGWIASPLAGASVQGQVPVTLISTENLASGTLTYWPTSNPSAVTTIKSGLTTTGGGTLGTFDGTILPNGGYTIQLNATDTSNNAQVSQVTVTVVGNYKPGRMTSTVTEFTVPLAGIPITISRTYDSLEKNQIEDFGYGWKLNFGIGLSVDSQMNVTFNFNGQRQTFYFRPQPSSPWFGWLQVPQYIPQPGLHGTLISNGCGSVMNVQGTWQCFGPGTYQPTLYAYTDPIGRTYLITSSGQLQSIQDLNGNTLTVTSTGITSSVNGIVIPFVRDPNTGNITKITDLNNNPYTYSYDQNGNLQSVQYPGMTSGCSPNPNCPETYSYTITPTIPLTDHLLLSETDPRGNMSSDVYYSSTNDGGQTALDGRLYSITDTMQNTWTYSYNLATNTTTTTDPDLGTVTRTDDSLGNPLSVTEQVNSTTSRTTTYQYDAKENLVSMTDACGNGTCSDTVGSNHTWQYAYDGNGFQISIQDPLGNTSHKTYNAYGGVLTATDAANTNTQTTTYDANFNPQQTVDLQNGPNTFVSSATYDALGNRLTSTDSNSKTTQYAYDPSGNLAQVTDALSEITHNYYDPMGRVQLTVDAMGNRTQFTYDALGHLKTKTDALNKVTQYSYDNNGNKTSETDANTNITRYDYDNMNRLTKITYPDTTSKQYTYDFRGNELTETDQSGHVTKYVYDYAGELTSVTYAYGTTDAGTINYTYDLDGRQATAQDELGNLTTNKYDVAGRLITVTDALTHATNYGYDGDNRKTSVQDANLNTTTYNYDARGRMSKITYPIVPPAQATMTQYTYDGMGRLLTTTDQAGKITTKTYDDVGRLSTVKDAMLPTGNVTQYFYDANGNLRFLEDALYRVTSYQYDPLNRRASRTLPLNQIEYYTYDPVGNLQTHTDFNGKTTPYNYDTLNRLLSKVPDSSLNQPTVSFTYTPTGRRLSMTDATGTTNYTSYDNRDRLKTKATPEGTLNYTYDAHGNVKSVVSSNPNGASLAYNYDVLSRLSQICDNRIAPNCGAAGATNYSYDAASNLTSYTYPNTVQIQNVFDTQNRLTQTCGATTAPACSANQKLASYTYTLGNAGNRTNVAELNGRNVVYGYDNNYRLTSEAITGDPAGNNGTVSYTQYDTVGNRLQMTSTLSAVPSGSFTYDANDRLSTDVYDANGNTISSAGISNTYDFENRITGHGAAVYVYDGDGNRVSETVGGTMTKYLVDTLNPTRLPQILDELANGSVTRTFAYGLQRISENQLINGAWMPTSYGYDGHGNVRFLANTAGAITDSYDFDAFGMSIRTSGATPNPFFYSSERLDGGTGLYDLRARYYDQATGRFWGRDPVEGKKCCGLSWNPYIFVRDDPSNNADPTGREVLILYLVQLNETQYQARHFARPIGQCLGATLVAEGALFSDYQLGRPVEQGANTRIVGNFENLFAKAALNLTTPSFPLPLPPNGAQCQNPIPSAPSGSPGDTPIVGGVTSGNGGSGNSPGGFGGGTTGGAGATTSY